MAERKEVRQWNNLRRMLWEHRQMLLFRRINISLKLKEYVKNENYIDKLSVTSIRCHPRGRCSGCRRIPSERRPAPQPLFWQLWSVWSDPAASSETALTEWFGSPPRGLSVVNPLSQLNFILSRQISICTCGYKCLIYLLCVFVFCCWSNFTGTSQITQLLRSNLLRNVK